MKDKKHDKMKDEKMRNKKMGYKDDMNYGKKKVKGKQHSTNSKGSTQTGGSKKGGLVDNQAKQSQGYPGHVRVTQKATSAKTPSVYSTANPGQSMKMQHVAGGYKKKKGKMDY